MAAIDRFRELLDQLPDDLPVSRDLLTGLISDMQSGPLTIEHVGGGLIGAVIHLERRVAAIENSADDGEDDIPMSGGIEPPFDVDDRPWQQR